MKITDDQLMDLQNLADEMASNLRQIKEIIRHADHAVYQKANRTWIADIALALDDANPEGWMTKRDYTFEDTIDDLKGEGK